MGLRYVALGDSYTVGTSVTPDERWPNQLVSRLATGGESRLDLVANLGVNGYTSRDVIIAELPRLPELLPEFASLLVGVNDVVQGVAAETFRANAQVIVDRLLTHVPRNRLVVVSTPDYTVTPQGASYGDPATQSAGIRQNNGIIAELARAQSIAYVDIVDLSLAARDDLSLVADDGLHPSGRQYRLWVDRIAPVVGRLLAS